MFIIIWGTSYFNKQNQHAEIKICRHCKKIGTLQTFDAKKAGHVYYIPLSSKGMFHVSEFCSQCDRGIETPLEIWREQVREAEGKIEVGYRQRPDDPACAIEAVNIYEWMGRPEAATPIIRQLARDFPAEPQVQARVASYYAARGMRPERPDPTRGEPYRDVHETSDLEQRQIAGKAIRNGEFPRAWEALRQIRQWHTPLDFVPTLRVANELRKAGFPGEAYEAYQRLIDEDPARARSNEQLLRGLLAVEKHLGVEQTIMPQGARPHQTRNVLIACAGGLVALGLVANFVMSRNQKLYLSNPLASEVTFVVDETNAITLPPGELEIVRVPEGNHHVDLQHPNFQESVDFEIDNGFFERFAGRSVFFVSALGAELIVEEDIIYSVDRDEEGDWQVWTGDLYYEFRGVYYGPDATPPEEIRLEHGRRATRKALTRIRMSPTEALRDMSADVTDPAELALPLDYATAHLLGGYHEAEFLRNYLAIADMSGERETAEALLTSLDLVVPAAEKTDGQLQ